MILCCEMRDSFIEGVLKGLGDVKDWEIKPRRTRDFLNHWMFSLINELLYHSPLITLSLTINYLFQECLDFLKEVDMTFNTRTIEHILFKLYTQII